MTKIALIANGDFQAPERCIDQIRSSDILIAVDGGLNHCHRLHLKPDYILGDQDSLSPNLLSVYPSAISKTYPTNKDKTDLELAVEFAMTLHPSAMFLFAALGKRTDHTLSNINLLSRYPGKLFIESAQERLFVIPRHITLSCEPGQTISLIPLNGPAKGITTKGLKWELSHSTLDKHFMGISNVALQKTIEISVDSGDLLCCINFS